ncbi:hypothetical protein KAJ41_02310 [Candidatus Parcubacteria bacterium]|nr:hypothetical protein [Candidatus Parcubacteria bacterium]
MRTNQKITILSLGAESCGRFAVFSNGDIFMSKNFGDLLDNNNFTNYKIAVLKRIKTSKPDVILTDLHPHYVSTIFGEVLSVKYKIPHLKVQHHLAHIFSAVGEFVQNNNNLTTEIKKLLPDTFYGISSDGTGYGLDGNIWGGEIFKVKSEKQKDKSKNLIINRIGSLEEQTMLGGDLAVKEPARMLIAILDKFLPKEKVNENVKKFYSENQFELFYNQLQQNFNCQKTTSTGRILDAVSILLGFSKNERKSKHEATKILEKHSTTPYQINPKIIFDKSCDRYILPTTPLFEYLLKNISKDKKRLAATAQLYLAQGFLKIIKQDLKHKSEQIFFAGGMANNQIISSYLENNNVYTSKKIPRGDEGIAFGQIIYYILSNQ